MFLLFFRLYASMFIGQWVGNVSKANLETFTIPILKEIGTFFTSIFGDNQMTDLGTILGANTPIGSLSVDLPNYLILVSLVLALITSIGIVVVATKGIKKLFTVFFYGVR